MNDKIVYTQDWFTRNIPRWKEVLGGLAGKEHLRFLEIGAFEGRSTNWLLDNILTAETSEIQVTDTFEGNMEFKEHNADATNLRARFEENTKLHKDKILVYEGRSQDILFANPAIGADFDVIYIDGSHKANDVLRDIVYSWELLKHGGIMIMDDYDWRFYEDEMLLPKSAIDAFLKIYKDEYELIERYQQVIVKKI